MLISVFSSLTADERNKMIVIQVVCTVLSSYLLNGTALGRVFDGIGGLSAGASSRALVDYPESERSDILDLLFKPQYGASFQILKVEIGGDSQSTDGTESSHMHSRDKINYDSGYEWWLIKEAKSRNPDIKIYGLPWAFPAWIATNITNPTTPYSDPRETASYVATWVHGVEVVYGYKVDYIGVWNERASSEMYVHELRNVLNERGFSKTKIVAADGGSDICEDLVKNESYAANVDIIGLHYPSDYDNYSLCYSLDKPIWSSEESSSFDDYNGASCWARIITSHYVLSNITSSIIWSIIGSMYHGTGWFGAGSLTAVEPWSGHYSNEEVLWSTAHITQFTQIGWKYLSQGSGSGVLDKGGYYTTFFDGNNSFSTIMVKISHEHAQCVRPQLPVEPVEDEIATFKIENIFKGKTPSKLSCFRSNFVDGKRVVFEKQNDIVITQNSFTISIRVGDIITISTVDTAQKGQPLLPPQSSLFPLPYNDDFSSYSESTEPKFLSSQIGSFQIVSGRLQQMVPRAPIPWAALNGKGPVTLIGMSEWEDIAIGIQFILTKHNSSACVATRTDQSWDKAMVLCASSNGDVSLYAEGPNVNISKQLPAIITTKVSTIPLGKVTTLNLTTVGGFASGYLDGDELFKNIAIEEGYFGLAAFGTNAWVPTQFLSVSILPVGDRWRPIKNCQQPAQIGDQLSTKRCQPNSIMNEEQQFTLSTTWQLIHTQSGLCVTVNGLIANGTVLILEKCIEAGHNAVATQYFYNEYSNIRNEPRNLNINASDYVIVAEPHGDVYISTKLPSVSGSWSKWAYFPNSNQLRNQYTHSAGSGIPLCLSRC